MASVDYAVQDNVGLSAGYGFNSKDQSGKDLSDFYRAELNYKILIPSQTKKGFLGSLFLLYKKLINYLLYIIVYI